MVHHLCWRLTSHRFWSIVGGLLFVLYPHSVFAVGWRASQNVVLQTALTLPAVLVYVRASGLNLAPDAPRQEGVPRLRLTALACVMLLWVLAVLSRETAIVLPALLVALDLGFGGWRHVRARWPVYAIMAAASIAFTESVSICVPTV